MNDNDVILVINRPEISTNLLNQIVHFSNQVNLKEGYHFQIICEHKPLRLKGDLRQLTSSARQWFAYWNANDVIRNISIVEDKDE